jgi:hypothetical protein
VSVIGLSVLFGVAKSTTGNIDKNREVIPKAWEEICDSEKKKDNHEKRTM